MNIEGPFRPDFGKAEEPEAKKPKKSSVTRAAKKALDGSEPVEKSRKLTSSSSEDTEIVISMAQEDFVDGAVRKLAPILRGKAAISHTDLPIIFQLESELRHIVSLPYFPERARYKKIYQKMLPLLEKAKAAIRNHPMHFSVQAAAEKGKAAVVGQEALHKIDFESMKDKKTESAQEVYLYPEYGTVLKRMEPQAREESQNVDALLNILSKRAVLGTFEFKEEDLEAKPFVEMCLIEELSSMPVAAEKIARSLSPEAQYIGILTGELQLLDLHNSNLAVVPDVKPELERYSDFKLDGEAVSLNELILAYLNDEIDVMVRISYTENGVQHISQLNNLPKDLREAFDAQWKFVLFDTDKALGESNSLQFFLKDGQKGHLVPLRSCLLEHPWKDIPLSEAAIDRLSHSLERETVMQMWAERDDAAIYRQLPKAARAEVKEVVRERAREFSLTHMRTSIDSILTFEDIQARFATSLIENTPENRRFWRMIQKHYKVSKKLRANTPEAESKRFRIACQLFPRLTVQQQEALYSRQAARNSYLTNYKRLEAPNISSVAEMRQFIGSCPSLFTTARRAELLEELRGLKTASRKSVGEFKAKLLEEVKPTYFNVMKTMYPLLADVYELTAFVHGDEDVGALIGHFELPIEATIQEARKKCSPDSPMGILATRLEKEIQEAKNPSFLDDLYVSKPKPQDPIHMRLWNYIAKWL